jgi:hypothetical protein
MEPTASAEQRTAAVLVGALEEMLSRLAAGAKSDREVGWLRPLAVLGAEIEYTALRRPTVDSTGLADECRELSALLACQSDSNAEFAKHYPLARRASPAVAALHDRIRSACEAVAARDAVTRKAA